MAGKRFRTVKVSGEPTGSVLLTPHVVTLKTNEAALVRLSRSWLRDSCQCERCVDPHSGQKRFAEADVPLNPPISSATLAANQSLRIVWADDVFTGGAAHTSVYPKALWSQSEPGGRPRYAESVRPRRLWDRASFESELRFVPYSDWMQGGAAFWRALVDLHEKGLILLEGVPDSETAVVDVANQIGVVQSTFYGTTWDVVSKPRAENVAYTSEFLGLHQDLCYMAIPPYIQLLHCLRNECHGGESLFSDGVEAAVELNLKDPQAALLLSRVPVRYKYDRRGHYYAHSHPVIQTPQTAKGADARDGRRVRYRGCAWSPPFQDVQSQVDHGEDWRSAAKAFSAILSSPENVVELKLKPGQCVLFNNQRILHGRRQFDTTSGHRWLKGAYIEKQVFQSKLQHLPGDIPAAPMLAQKGQVGAHESAQVARLLAARPPSLGAAQPAEDGEVRPAT